MARWLERVEARWKGFELREELRFARALGAHGRPDVVHAHFGPQGFAAAKACAAAKVPLVTTFYGYDLGIAGDGSWARRYEALWSAAAAFLVEGPFMGAHLVRLGAPEAKVRVQPLPVPVGDIPVRARVRASGEPLRLIQIARFVEKKGLDLTVRALARIEAPPSGVELTLVGDGPLASELRALARNEGVEDRVVFAGLLPHDEVRRLRLRAHLLVQPSRTAANGDTEGGAPYVLLEAQASGMCVVASRHADIPNTMAPEAWFPFDEDDLDGLVAALDEAVAGADTWADRGAAGRAFVEARHSASALVQQLEGLYDSVRSLS